MDDRPFKLAKLKHDTSSDAHNTSDKKHAELETDVEEICNKLLSSLHPKECVFPIEHKIHNMAFCMSFIANMENDSKCFESFTQGPAGSESNFKHIHRSFGPDTSEKIQHIKETDLIPDLV